MIKYNTVRILKQFYHLDKVLPGISIEDVFKINLMILEVISEHPETQLAGMIAIADFTGFKWLKHYQYLSPYYAKKSAEVVQVRNTKFSSHNSLRT